MFIALNGMGVAAPTEGPYMRLLAVERAPSEPIRSVPLAEVFSVN